ncbi:MAG TPA: phenylalanine--tRNA ligase beta subunit-related protein [Ktedonosporobacter sp.]|jgi:DNA/RNA-binding domain of Phe-tRNA-synthetase-like protein|nr:phenylalanine--tRNA ligase beta subunit-related protein [Ktedonosporobacter sp.]
MHLEIHPDARKRIVGITLGTVTITHIQVMMRNEQLWKQIEELSEHVSKEYKLENLSQQSQVAAVRELQKMLGFDPARYRPSSESLLRRVLKGQGLHQVNTAVDVNNLCSLEFLLPMSIYDLRNIEGQIHVRIGSPGEQYPGIGRQLFQIEDKIIVADSQGVIGSTVSDSERTKVTTATTDAVLIIYAPPSLDLHTVKSYTELAGQRIVEFNGGVAGDIEVCRI